MAQRKSTKGQKTIYKNKRSSNTNPTKIKGMNSCAPEQTIQHQFCVPYTIKNSQGSNPDSFKEQTSTASSTLFLIKLFSLKHLSVFLVVGTDFCYY